MAPSVVKATGLEATCRLVYFSRPEELLLRLEGMGMEAFGMAGVRRRKAGQVAGAGLLRSYEATAMVEDGVWRLDTGGIRPTPELPALRQPLFRSIAEARERQDMPHRSALRQPIRILRDWSEDHMPRARVITLPAGLPPFGGSDRSL